jgi:hypothetical protein
MTRSQVHAARKVVSGAGLRKGDMVYMIDFKAADFTELYRTITEIVDGRGQMAGYRKITWDDGSPDGVVKSSATYYVVPEKPEELS